MTTITLRKAAVGLLVAVAVSLAGTGGAAYADESGAAKARAAGAHATIGQASMIPMDAGNNNASVAGVPYCSALTASSADCWTWESTTQVDCPSGHFCLYTNSLPAAGGKVFSLFHCRDYSLSNWLDQGFVWNHNTGGKAGYLKDRNHVKLVGGTFPAGARDWFDFFPVWYVQAC